MGSIILVHGTGVREDSYKESLSKVGEKLLARRVDLTLIPCFWGEKYGANSAGKLRSIPVQNSSRSIDDLNDDDYSTGIWGLLYDDPLCELRILGIKTKQTSMAVPNQLSPYQQLDGEIKRIKIEGELGEIFRICGLSTVWDDAKRDVTTSQDYKSALNTASAATDDYRQAIIRAIIAQAILTLRERKKLRYDESPIAPRDRDRITELLLEQMGVHRGVIGWIAKQALGRPATWFIRRNRADYSESAYPMIGDILLYQSRGQAIRDLIREKIKEAKPPVILLAHSLGGIACVDLLITESLPDVNLLITAGSQSPFFYEIGALGSLESGKPLPGHFPSHWLNFYDPRDFLAYIAEPVFPADPVRKITDIRVNNREPFPQSHTSYWNNDDLWDAINDRINEALQ